MTENMSPARVVIGGQPVLVEDVTTKEMLAEIIELLTEISEKLED